MTSRRTITTAATLLSLSALLGVAGCSGAQDSGSSAVAAPAGREAGGGSAAAAAPAADGNAAYNDQQSKPGVVDGAATSATDAGTVGAPGAAGVVVPSVQLIRTAEVVVQVDALPTSAARVRSIAESLGGTVSSEVTAFPEAPDVPVPADSGSSDQRSARPGESVMVLRVPVSALEQAVDKVVGVGTVLSRSSSSVDVTADIADVDSRVKTQQASVDRVRQLLAKAGSLQDVVLLEAELSRREADLEALQARQASLKDRAALSTITVTLRTPQAVVEDDDENGFLVGLDRGWQAVIATTTILLTVLGALLPLAVVVAVVGLPVWWLLRRRRAGRPTPTTPGPAAPAAPPTSTPSTSSTPMATTAPTGGPTPPTAP